MLKGTRDAELKAILPISVHGQRSWEITFMHLDDPESQLHAARIGPEGIAADSLEPADAGHGRPLSGLWARGADRVRPVHDLRPVERVRVVVRRVPGVVPARRLPRMTLKSAIYEIGKQDDEYFIAM